MVTGESSNDRREAGSESAYKVMSRSVLWSVLDDNGSLVGDIIRRREHWRDGQRVAWYGHEGYVYAYHPAEQLKGM